MASNALLSNVNLETGAVAISNSAGANRVTLNTIGTGAITFPAGSNTLVGTGSAVTVAAANTFTAKQIIDVDDDDNYVPTTNGAALQITAATHKDATTAGSGTAAKMTAVALEIPTLKAANAAVTTIDAATLYIEGAPAAHGSGNQTITNAHALWVDAGNTRLDGTLTMGGTRIRGIDGATGGALTVAGGDGTGGAGGNLSITAGTGTANGNLLIGTLNTTAITIGDPTNVTGNVVVNTTADIVLGGTSTDNITADASAITLTAGGSNGDSAAIVSSGGIILATRLVAGTVSPIVYNDSTFYYTIENTNGALNNTYTLPVLSDNSSVIIDCDFSYADTGGRRGAVHFKSAVTKGTTAALAVGVPSVQKFSVGSALGDPTVTIDTNKPVITITKVGTASTTIRGWLKATYTIPPAITGTAANLSTA